MRLDRYLWFTRLAKTRGLAQEMASDGRFRIDGRRIDRAHAPVRIGNILTFVRAGTVRVLRVELIPVRRGPAPEAQACYRDLDITPAAEIGGIAGGATATNPENENGSQKGAGN